MIARNYVGGQWIEPQIDNYFEVHNPSTGDLIGKTPLSSTEQTAAAIKIAHAAFQDWRYVSASNRVRPIFQLVELLWQLQGRYDRYHGDPEMWTRYGKKKPDDWRSLQVPNAKRGCAISHAGTGSHVTCAIVEKP